MPPASLSQWCGCSRGSCPGEGFSEGHPYPDALRPRSGHLTVFAASPGSAAAQGPAPVVRLLDLLMWYSGSFCYVTANLPSCSVIIQFLAYPCLKCQYLLGTTSKTPRAA